MESNQQPPDGYSTDDFLEQILDIPSYSTLTVNDVGSSSDTASMTSTVSALHHHHQQQQSQLFPLGLSLDNNGGDDAGDCRASFDLKHVREPMNMGNMYPVYENLHPPAIRHIVPQSFLGQPSFTSTVSVPQPPTIRPRVRARRGQATDPHSIAERLRRERISEKIKALQELVPCCNKTDRAAMLDEILDYVKFLRLQVKVLSMSRLGGAGAVAQLVADIPRSLEGENWPNPRVFEQWSNEEAEQEVAKLMEEDVGAAMQFLQSKSLCIMPLSLAAIVYPTRLPDDQSMVKPEPPVPS